VVGIVVHFIDAEYNLQTFLLSLPHISGRHTGVNQSELLKDIIQEFQIQDKIGFFVIDYAENNDACISDLAAEFGFSENARCRCMGHCFNLASRDLLFGTDPDGFKEDLDGKKEDAEDTMAMWLKKGSVGKLHNFVVWAMISPQRLERFYDQQKLQIIPNGTDEQKKALKTYDPVRDNKTRWNSSDAMIERGIQPRPSIDAMIDIEVEAYIKQLNSHHAPRTLREVGEGRQRKEAKASDRACDLQEQANY
jgi:hypothetical protein